MGTDVTPVARVRLRVRGRVQGVGFRWHIRELGRRLGLAGYVRNEEDGAVLAEHEVRGAGLAGLGLEAVDVADVVAPG